MDKKNEKIEKIEDVTTQKTEKIAGEIKKEEKKEEKVKAKEILGEVNIVPEVIAGTLLGTKELEKGINVDLRENKEVSTTISVILEYGSIIIDVAKEIQKKVKGELETKTGLKVTGINVNIQGVHIEEKK